MCPVCTYVCFPFCFTVMLRYSRWGPSQDAGMCCMDLSSPLNHEPNETFFVKKNMQAWVYWHGNRKWNKTKLSVLNRTHQYPAFAFLARVLHALGMYDALPTTVSGYKATLSFLLRKHLLPAVISVIWVFIFLVKLLNPHKCIFFPLLDCHDT